MAEIKYIPELPGGVNWADKSFQTNAPTGSHENITILDIDGSGYLVSISSMHPSGNRAGIQIDNGSIYKVNPYNTGIGLFPIRFNNSLKVTANHMGYDANDISVWVVLD